MTKEVESLTNALRQTLSSDADVRASGEGYLLEREQNAGSYWKQVCEICTTTSLRLELRQSAATYLKNQVKRSFVPDEKRNDGRSIITPERAEDCDFLKDNLIEILVMAQDFFIRTLIAECARIFSFHLLPEKWPTIIDKLDQALSGNDQQYAVCGLLVLRRIVSRYKFEHREEKRQPLGALQERLFPRLLQLADQLLQVAAQPSPHQVDAFTFLKVILQIYFSSIFNRQEKDTYIAVSIESWMTLMAKVIEFGFPENLLPADLSKVYTTPMAKCEKRALQVVLQFFKSLTSVHMNVGDQFSKDWEQKYAPFFSKYCLQCLQKPYRSEKSNFNCFRYLAISFRHASAYPTVAAEFEPLLAGAFDFIYYNDQDEESWVEDPIEYYRETGGDFCSFVPTIRYAVLEFIKNAAKYRKELVPKIFILCTAKIESGDPRYVDGALRILGELSDRLINRDVKESGKDGGVSVADILQNYAFPLLQSPHKFLRLRAAWMYHRFAEELKGASMVPACEQVLVLMEDQELPVRAQACESIKGFLKRADCRHVISPKISPLVTVILQVMIACASDNIMQTIHEIAENYDKEIVPVAASFCRGLLVHLDEWMDNDDDDNLSVAAMASFTTVVTVVEVCSKQNPESLVGLLDILAHFLDKCLCPKFAEYWDSTIEILSIFSEKLPTPFADPMWGFFVRILEIINGPEPREWAKMPGSDEIVYTVGDEVISKAIPFMCNLIMRDSSFWSRSWKEHNYVQLMKLMIQRIIQIDETGPVMMVFCAMFRACPDRYRTELVNFSVPFLWECIQKNARREDALFALCVLLYTDSQLFFQTTSLAQFLENLRNHSLEFSGSLKRIARIHALVCIARSGIPELNEYGHWMWECLRQDIETVLNLAKKECETELEFDGFSDAESQDLGEHENAKDKDCFDQAIFDELEDDAEDDIDNMVTMLPLEDALRAAAGLMRDYSQSCSEKRWDSIKETLEKQLGGGLN